jgi:hypothetical protein
MAPEVYSAPLLGIHLPLFIPGSVFLHPLNQVLRHWLGYKKLQLLFPCQGVFPGLVPVSIHVIHIQGEKVKIVIGWLQTVGVIRLQPLEDTFFDAPQGLNPHTSDADKYLMVHLIVLLFFSGLPKRLTEGDQAVFGIFSKINI